MRNATIAALLTLVISQAASAQVFSRSTPGPDRTAAGEAWYASREPLYVLGDYYYPAGSTRFFDGNRMVASTFYDGVPIYQDTTLEPYSVVFVPIGRGLVQPYERRRRGELAGTTGSFVPSFPVQNYAEAPALSAREQLALEEGRTEPRGLDAGDRRVVHARARGHDRRHARRGRHRDSDRAAAAASRWRHDGEAARVRIRGVGDLRGRALLPVGTFGRLLGVRLSARR